MLLKVEFISTNNYSAIYEQKILLIISNSLLRLHMISKVYLAVFLSIFIAFHPEVQQSIHNLLNLCLPASLQHTQYFSSKSCQFFVLSPTILVQNFVPTFIMCKFMWRRILSLFNTFVFKIMKKFLNNKIVKEINTHKPKCLQYSFCINLIYHPLNCQTRGVTPYI